MYDFDKMTDRRGTSCSKWDNMSSMFSEKGLLPLWIADMDFEAPEFICQAMPRRAAHRVLGYGMRTDAYYAAITNWVAIPYYRTAILMLSRAGCSVGMAGVFKRNGLLQA